MRLWLAQPAIDNFRFKSIRFEILACVLSGGFKDDRVAIASPRAIHGHLAAIEARFC
jgi:hypothetical protein